MAATLTPDNVSVVIPTRGDVDMSPITKNLKTAGFVDLVIWDNSKRVDEGIFGRYAAIPEAKHDVIVTQDDDLLVHAWDEILAEYEPGVLTVNYPEPWDVPWVACGSVFDRDLPKQAFARYLAEYPYDFLFTHRICDAVFALLSKTHVIDVGYEDLPHGYNAGRVSTTSGWYDRDRPEGQRRCQKIVADDLLRAVV